MGLQLRALVRVLIASGQITAPIGTQAMPDSYTGPASAGLWAGQAGQPVAPVTPAPFSIVPDGIWTWFTSPEAVFRNGATYIGWVNSAGTCGISKYTHATQQVQHFSLSTTSLEVDDHNNTSILFLPDGRIAAFYGQHNDPTFRYRVSTNPEDITAWGPEQARGTNQGLYSYPKPVFLSQDPTKHWLFSRRYYGGDAATRTVAFRTVSDLAGAAPHTWSDYTDVIMEANQRPYCRMVDDGVKRVHVAYSSGHPAEAAAIALHHVYMELDAGNTPRWYKSDGTLISSLPFTPAAGTRVDDGVTCKRWVSSVAIDAQGRPRILWMKYPNNDGSVIEYWHSRWDGSQWIASKITNDGAGLYAAEQYYHGGLVFDSKNANLIYLSAPISGVRQIQEWITADNGLTWTQRRQITSGGAAGAPFKLRPISPVNHDGSLPVLWVEGSYISYTSYSTVIKGSP